MPDQPDFPKSDQSLPDTGVTISSSESPPPPGPPKVEEFPPPTTELKPPPEPAMEPAVPDLQPPGVEPSMPSPPEAGPIVSPSPPEEAAAALVSEEPPKRGINLKKFLPFVLVLIVFIALIWIGYKIILPRLSPGSQEVTLTYWGLWEPETIYSSVVSEYQQSHPNVKIEYVQHSPKRMGLLVFANDAAINCFWFP